MKPSRIDEIMDLAYEARKVGQVWNPIFIGEAGLGKSQIVQQWVAKKRKENPEFGFLDQRIAYYEAPDMIGFPKEIERDGRWRTIHALPGFWPTEGEGLILLEEPNRGTTGVMNCLMQLLTDRQVGHDYKLPDGWIIAAAINPDSAEYDVNAMDTALMDRFEPFAIDYDHNTFVNYIEATGWHEEIVRYIKSGAWVYKTSDKIAKDGKYISPRTWSKVNAAMIAGGREKGQAFHRIICQSALGKHIGNEFWKTCWDDAPVTAADLLSNEKAALKKLEKQCKHGKNSNYEGDKIAMTVESIVTNYGGLADECPEGKINEDTMAKVAMIIPKDQAVNLIRDCGYKVHKGQITSYLQEFVKRHKDLIDVMRSNIKIGRATGQNK